MDEFAFIDRFLRPLANRSPEALGLRDDAALLSCRSGEELVLTKDALVEGVHFFPDDPPDLVARKLLRVNLSDLAAMGGEPLGYLMALALPRRCDERWAEAFVGGLADDQLRFGLGLFGGDTVSSPDRIVLSLTAIGTVPAGRALRRSGARPGDDIWVSGTLGDAALGLRILMGLAVPEEEAEPFVMRYRLPEPRIALGRALRGLAHAAIDISDGLIADLGHVCSASSVAAEIELERLPVRALARGIPGWREAALAGGDDYELLFTAAPTRRAEVEALSAELALPLARIGRIAEGSGVRVVDASGKEVPLSRTGYRHEV